MIIRSNLLSLSTTAIGQPVIGYDNNLTVSNIEASSEDTSYPATNLANPATHLPWKSGVNTGDVYLTITGLQGASGTDLTDYVAIAGHNFGSARCTVTIQGTVDPNSPFDSPGFSTLVQATAITDDQPLIFQFVPQVINTVRIVVSSGGDDVRRAAVVYAGLLLTLERGVKVDVEHKPVSLARQNDIVNGMSESGQFLGRIVKKQEMETKFEFAWFTNAWYRAYFDPFVVAVRDIPFFICWAPNDYTSDVGYVWLTADVEPFMNLPVRRFAATLQTRGIA